MIEVDLNNGMFRKIDLNKPVFCVKCKKEIIRDTDSNNLNINVHTCGYAFCRKCKKKLNEFAGKKLADYERKLVEDFIKDKVMTNDEKKYFLNMVREEALTPEEVGVLCNHDIPFEYMTRNMDDQGNYHVLIAGEDLEQLEYWCQFENV